MSEYQCFRYVLDARPHGKKWVLFVSLRENVTALFEVCSNWIRWSTDNWTSLGRVFCGSFAVVGQQSLQGITSTTRQLMLESCKKAMRCLFIACTRSCALWETTSMLHSLCFGVEWRLIRSHQCWRTYVPCLAFHIWSWVVVPTDESQITGLKPQGDKESALGRWLGNPTVGEGNAQIGDSKKITISSRLSH